MKSEVNEIALQGIEFWSTVCDEETDLAIEAAEAEEQGRPPEQVSRFYVKGALSFLIDVLLQTLTKQVGVAILCIPQYTGGGSVRERQTQTDRGRVTEKIGKHL